MLINHLLFASPTLFDLLHVNTNFEEQIITFNKTAGTAHSIEKLRIHFLTGEDCYSGYSGVYATSNNDLPFFLEKNLSFTLSPTQVYHAGLVALNNTKINEIHSILLRLISNNKQFGLFMDSCSDQEINCCIPVRCSMTTGQCLPQHPLEIQRVFLN